MKNLTVFFLVISLLAPPVAMAQTRQQVGSEIRREIEIAIRNEIAKSTHLIVAAIIHEIQLEISRRVLERIRLGMTEPNR